MAAYCTFIKGLYTWIFLCCLLLLPRMSDRDEMDYGKIPD